MAQAELEAVHMRTAYEQLKSDNLEQKETAVQVGKLRPNNLRPIPPWWLMVQTE